MNHEQTKLFNKYCRLSIEQVEKLPTPRLLSYYRKVREGSYVDAINMNRRRGIAWTSKEYFEYLSKVKSILDTRQHIQRKTNS